MCAVPRQSLTCARARLIVKCILVLGEDLRPAACTGSAEREVDVVVKLRHTCLRRKSRSHSNVAEIDSIVVSRNEPGRQALSGF